MRPEDVYELTSAGDPRLSPDGRLIAYVVTRIDREESTYRSAIWVVPVDGSAAPRQFTSGERRKHLFIVGVDGGDERQLSEGDCEDDQPAWSPDGKQIAFSSLRGERWDVDLREAIYVLDVDGSGEPRKLTAEDEAGNSPSF